MTQEDFDHIRQQIDTHAAGNYATGTHAGKVYRTPQVALENWALRRTHGAHLATKYAPFSVGFSKCYWGDDPYHTDAVIGLQQQSPEGDWVYCFQHDTLSECYKGDENDVMWRMQYAVQREKLNFKCAVLSGNGYAIGKVWHWLTPEARPKHGDYTVFVIPHAGPEFIEAAETAIERDGAVITEVGGGLSHLANVGRERGLKLVRVEKARDLYSQDAEVMVFCEKGEVSICDSK